MADNLEREHNCLNDPEFQKNLIADNFQLLAAIGWHSYLSDGKGFLLISSFTQSIKCPHWLVPSSSTDFTALYIGENNQAFQALFRRDWGVKSSHNKLQSP